MVMMDTTDNRTVAKVASQIYEMIHYDNIGRKHCKIDVPLGMAAKTVLKMVEDSLASSAHPKAKAAIKGHDRVVVEF